MSWTIWKTRSFPDSRSIHSTRSQRASWNEGRWNKQDAVKLMTECISLREKILGPRHPDTHSLQPRRWLDVVTPTDEGVLKTSKSTL